MDSLEPARKISVLIFISASVLLLAHPVTSRRGKRVKAKSHKRLTNHKRLLLAHRLHPLEDFQNTLGDAGPAETTAGKA